MRGGQDQQYSHQPSALVSSHAQASSTNLSRSSFSDTDTSFSDLSSEMPELRRLSSINHSSDQDDSVDDSKPQRTRSILNLTSSALLGIYNPGLQIDTSVNTPNPSEPPTPWGTGALTPARSTSIDGGFHRLTFTSITTERKQRPRRPRTSSFHVAHRTKSQITRGYLWRGIVLAAMGVAYGELIRHLHDTRHLAPVQVDGINRRSWFYTSFWAFAGVAFGFLMPLLDSNHENAVDDDDDAQEDDSEEKPGRVGLGAEWNPIVRNVGAFIGIAFAIRKLPWRSTLQVSVTLALANPVIWFLLDRSRVGFLLSTVVGVSGAAALMLVNPKMIPAPTMSGYDTNTFAGVISYESIGVATWIASVLFISCVVFGNVGRRLVAEKQLDGSHAYS